MPKKQNRKKIFNQVAIFAGLFLFSWLLIFNIIGIAITLQRLGFENFLQSTDVVKKPKSEVDYVAKPARIERVLASSYSSTIDQTDSTPCITANGYNVCSSYEKFGFGETIATNFLPMNTVVKIPELYGDNFLVVRDRMNSRYGDGRIDIWMPSRSEALVFGKRWIDIEIFDFADNNQSKN